MSRALASTISSVRAMSASAIACSAAFFVSVSSVASARAASRASRQISETERVTVAMVAKGTRRSVRAGPGSVRERATSLRPATLWRVGAERWLCTLILFIVC